MWCQLRNSNIAHDAEAGALRVALRAARSKVQVVAAAIRNGPRAALVALAGAVVLAIASPTRADAQVVTPADSAGVLVGVAERLQAEGRPDLAATLLRLVRERYPNTPAAEHAQRLLATHDQSRRDQSGKTEMIVFGTTYGVALGIGLPVTMQAESPEAYGLGLILGAPAGFLLSRQYARSRPLSEGQASAIISGALWGAWQTFGWAHVMDVGEEEFCDYSFPEQPGGYCYEEDMEAHEAVGTMILGSVVGLGVGAALSQKNISRGTAATANFGALWGTWIGLAAAIFADQGDDSLLGAALIGGNAGLVGATLGNRRWQLSEQRARLISIAGVGGLVAGFGLLLLTTPEDADNSTVLVPLAGSLGGLGLGAYWTRHMERDALLPVNDGKRFGLQVPAVQPGWTLQNGKRIAVVRLNLLQARF